MVKALIFGITGQDGSYLTEFLLEKGYEIHGMIRRSSTSNLSRIEHLCKDNRISIHYGDLSDSLNIFNIINNIKPDEIYNLGAMSHVRISFDSPEYTANIDGLGTLRILEAIRIIDRKIKFYQASTSELYGLVQEIPQREITPFYPRSPYGVAKLYSYWITINYRESYNIFATNGILFNHESPRRGVDFVTRKITMGVSSIFHGKQDKLFLGNLDSQRDWGHARDYVEGMWKILQYETPEDFVLATGKTYTVRKFVEDCFKYVNINIIWNGSGMNEKGYNDSGRILVEIDPIYFRPTEVDLLLGDSSKAREKLNWIPNIGFDELVKEMMDYDLSLIKH